MSSRDKKELQQQEEEVKIRLARQRKQILEEVHKHNEQLRAQYHFQDPQTQEIVDQFLAESENIMRRHFEELNAITE